MPRTPARTLTAPRDALAWRPPSSWFHLPLVERSLLCPAVDESSRCFIKLLLEKLTGGAHVM